MADVPLSSFAFTRATAFPIVSAETTTGLAH
jgi:hypothetical protein